VGLATYQRKRDFRHTPEPRGRVHPRAARLSFVIQKHAARRLHYDFRLEMEGVLRSWAIPKGPSLGPGEKRLAVLVEDHPLEYGGFEGTIPRGEYGGGTVMLWDRGRWIPEGDPVRGFREGRLKFALEGEKLRGRWMLVRIKGRDQDDEGKTWLLFKERDDEARAGGDVLKEAPLSVATGRDLDEIAGGAAVKRRGKRGAAVPPARAVWHSSRGGKESDHGAGSAHARRGRSPSARSRTPAHVPDPSGTPGARRAPMPETIAPELTTLVAEAPEGDEWLHEIKFDGYRVLACRDGREVRLLTRKGLDWSDRFPAVTRALAGLPVKRLWADGEVVALNPDGTSSFQALQTAMSQDRAEELVCYFFDLLYLEGWDLRAAPLERRKELLAELIASESDAVLRYSDHVVGRGPEFKRDACRHRLEGAISKRREAPYRSGRGRDWLKSKCLNRQEFVIAGWSDPAGSRIGFGALLVGVHEAGGRLVYAGKVGTGFNHQLLGNLERRLRKLEQPHPPLANPPGARGVHWVKPQLVAEIEFTEWTRDGLLRHPSFVGLREDKDPREAVRERPRAAEAVAHGDGGGSSTAAAPAASEPAPARGPRRPRAAGKPGRAAGGAAQARPSAGGSSGVTVAGVTITNPDRVVYPDQGITKRELAEYYERIADHMIPLVEDRPMMIIRYPDGLAGQRFVQKHASRTTPPYVHRVEVPEKDGPTTYVAARDAAGLVGLVQMSALEIHVWGARAARIEQPDRLVFDLDPDPAVEWPRVIEAARRVRDRLAEIGLRSFPCTTGGKGIHVVVPLSPRAGWDVVREFCRAVAESMVSDEPDRYTSVLSKARRQGKILIDWLRNGRGATAIAPYSSRARPGATVAAPLDWSEVTARLDPGRFTIRTLPRRIEKADDPWGELLRVRQTLSVTVVRKLERASARS
jgi:bifunctional non-homologous end joining protein LigD